MSDVRLNVLVEEKVKIATFESISVGTVFYFSPINLFEYKTVI